ncbi:MAG: acetyl-CoA carboxylase subunit beta [Deltaproteobacteria bacterium RIFCSPLOWO2_12_FULL_43_16]|nr:MAG: acetyl-CoA carboxylase subunit beta [Deltaproteobacteria bacterium GWA2_43_19]OGQ09630.1 MAG: acetyl-CoA carboxylase subunit beta [Deltaproteobacteria bacterium RIFCSPHIGHO2_02_FULL_43_33]OGQ36207.1 MAG: acetyl-CoA carboxylase subunit beta [Deltaproteobacteria bacterium RIFCSPLOWO2_01_FULL_42_9]OGQ60981.1 MAG: acetyl-CoA carboxylase subunit beta [Deltaproteobacteria bacterium RIFCSPLOWO2_12_FULL_43_16]HBR18088.1 acetyl-CoA carboxylase carboxyl transferase subunit beta [Deltaproteobacter
MVLKREKEYSVRSEDKRVRVPRGLWVKCEFCGEIIYKKEIEKNLEVCPKCNYHFRINSQKRLAMVFDEGSFVEFDAGIEPIDILDFKDTKKYKDRLKTAHKTLPQKDAFIYGEGRINGQRVMAGVFEFEFMGGSMGSVVGEKITRLIERAINKKCGVIIFSSSGGARMQEGIFSLMQMAKTCAALAMFRKAGLPYISVLLDPTMGGVTASFAMLGDIIIAEPKALIGFAGPRVIEQTIKQKLPEGFQRSEYLLEHGVIDMIVERKNMRDVLGKLLAMLTPANNALEVRG